MHTVRIYDAIIMGKARFSAISGDNIGEQFATAECLTVAEKGRAAKVYLTGHIARRDDLKLGMTWDTELPGFGLRRREGGARSWVLKYTHRGQRKFVTLGPAAALPAMKARAKARGLLAEAAMAGLPQRPKQKQMPTFGEFVAEFLRDYGPHWKPSTHFTNKRYIERELVVNFGGLLLDQIARSHIARWRDSLLDRPGVFNRCVPILSVMMGYAEKLGYRAKGTNPCKGIARYKRVLPERFLSTQEYRRLGTTLATMDMVNLRVRRAILMLINTGARSSEIADLRWREVQPPRLVLEDSKTGPKTIYLNSQAIAILDQLERGAPDDRVFPSQWGRGRLQLTSFWHRIRRHAAIPDVRLHDLRHSFASVAIAQNMPLATIGKLLGHALPETTARYTHLADTMIADTAARLCTGLATAFGVTHDQL